MKILIIQQKMIGDVLTTSILFKALRDRYPDAELHYVINTHTFPVVKHNPFIDKFVFFTLEMETSKLKLYSFLNNIKNEKYDIVIDVYGILISNLITRFSKAKIRISIEKSYTSFLYTHTFKNAIVAKTNAGLAIENRLQLLQPIIKELPDFIKPKIYLTETEKTDAKAFLIAHNINVNKPLIMVGVLGSDQSKTYPLHYMSKLLDDVVLQHPNVQLLFNYMPKQKEEASAIYNFCKPQTQSAIQIDLISNNLRHFMCLTSQCNALIGNEGGAINMAKALHIPTFTVFSPWIDKNAWSLFENGTTNVSVHLKDYKPELFENIDKKETKINQSEFYNAFKPEFFSDKLVAFLGDL